MEQTKPILIEVKRASLTAEGLFTGYAATFNGEPDFVGDVLLPGCFKTALAFHRRHGTQPALCWDHQLSTPIGKWLSLEEDDFGLLAKGKLTLEVPKAAEALALMRDDVLCLSIRYVVATNGATSRSGIRYIHDISRLIEISVTPLPANHRAKIQDVRTYEKSLRDIFGFSSRESKRLAAGGWKALTGDSQESELTTVLRKIDELQDQITRAK